MLVVEMEELELCEHIALVVEMEELCEHVALVVKLVVGAVGVELELVVTSAELPPLALSAVTIRRSTTVLGIGLRLRFVLCC